ncbi:MAG: hypothetical protein R2851_03615 [Caldilineaceae bacterium]
MGWERKRGKLDEFNRLLLARRHLFCQRSRGNGQAWRRALRAHAGRRHRTAAGQRPSAHRCAGASAQPCRVRPGDRRFLTAEATPFCSRTPRSTRWRRHIRPSATIFSGDTGIDLYTLAVSDVYQDLFGEGIYVGKGIYDVDAFPAALAERVPENHLLSHDLFEGIDNAAQ